MSLAGDVAADAPGEHAASSADPVTMPAVRRKSRRERYCEYGVISDDFTGTDLNLLSMITSIYPSLRVFEKQSPHYWGLFRRCAARNDMF